MTAVAGARGASVEQLLAEVQDRQARLDEQGEPATRELADGLVSAVVAMYGAGLERIAGELGPDGPLRALAEDPLIATLLLVHDLHPVGLAERVDRALESVRPYMESHGGNVELISLSDGVARIALRGSCSDCAASSATLELAIKQALEDAAPDLEGLEVQDMAPQRAGLELPMATDSLPMVAVAPRWVELPGAGPEEGALTLAEAGGEPVLVANVDGTLLAYQDVCAGCGGALHDGVLSSGALSCPGCGRSFFLPAAGRSMDTERIQLSPVPLLRDEGRVRVALGG